MTPHSAWAAPKVDAAGEVGSAAIDIAVNDALERATTPGVSVGIMRNGKIVFLRGYGLADIENAVPVSGDTAFRIGSISKQFTAAAVLLLQERGKLSIDDKLSKYYPDFPGGDKVSLRQMLAHTSGIRDYAGNPAFKNPALYVVDQSTDEIARRIAVQENLYDFAPGTSWAYSNSGYFLLGGIVEKVSGVSLGSFLEKNVFVPRGLTGTRMEDPDPIVPHRARGYIPKDGTFVNGFYSSTTLARGAGGLRSTAPDLLNWADALYGGRILKPKTLAVMTAPALLNDGRTSSAIREPEGPGRPAVNYGLGVRAGTWLGRKYIGHEGLITGFNTALYSFPDDGVTIVLLTNAQCNPATNTCPATDLFWKVAGAYFGQ